MAGASTAIQYQDPTMALLEKLLGTQTTQTQTATSDPASTAALQQLLAQMQGQTTPAGMQAQLAALFSEGAKQVPTLTQAYANASGARSANNSGLQLALGDLNGELSKQAAMLAMEQQKNVANVAGALGNNTRQQTSTSNTGTGMNPLLTVGLGVLANQANKRGWVDQASDAIGSIFDTGAADTSAAMNTSFMLPDVTYGETPDFGSGISYYIPDALSFGDAFAGANLEGLSSFLPEDFDFGFANGGSPQRNVANMGAVTPTMRSGALNLTPAQIQQMLSAPQATSSAPAATVAPTATGNTAATRNLREQGGNESSAPGFNDSYSPQLSSAVRSAFGINSALNLAGLGVPVGPVSAMMADERSQVLGNMAVAGVGMINPIAGLLAAAINKTANPATPTPVPSYAAPLDQQMMNTPGRTSLGGNRGPDAGFGTGATDPSGFGTMGGGINASSGNDNGDTGGEGAGDSGDSGYKDGGSPAGHVRGPGTGTSDSIPVPMAKISNGEYIMSADVVDAIGIDFLDSLQAMFHKGGKPA